MKFCKYCSVDTKDKLSYTDSDGEVVSMVIPDGQKDQLLRINANVCGYKVEHHFKINFCPMCGRELCEETK